MRTSTVVDYENASLFDGDDINSVMEACRANILALLKLKANKRIQINSINVTFLAKTTPLTPKIGLDNSFWLSVALETWEDE